MRHSEYSCSHTKVPGNSKLFKGVHTECSIFMYRYCFYPHRKKSTLYSNYEISLLQGDITQFKHTIEGMI